MADPVVWGVIVIGAQLAHSLVVLCTAPARERARAQTLAALVRAVGPVGVVAVVMRDGRVVITRAALGGGSEAAGR
jgi:hypothetical protein